MIFPKITSQGAPEISTATSGRSQPPSNKAADAESVGGVASGYVEDAFKTRTQTGKDLVLAQAGEIAVGFSSRHSRRACFARAHTIPVCSFELNPNFS